MTDLKLPSAMAELRPTLIGIIAEGYEQAPYFSVLLSSKQGLQIRVDNREERVTERTPTAGTVVSAFDGLTVYERAVTGFDHNEVRQAARELAHSVSFATYTPPDEPQRSGDLATEIRLGYLVENGIRKPFRGGRLIGNFLDALADVRWSAETGFFGNYLGPSTACFNDLEIAGQDE